MGLALMEEHKETINTNVVDFMVASLAHRPIARQMGCNFTTQEAQSDLVVRRYQSCICKAHDSADTDMREAWLCSI